jgi:hypothetical protein
MCNGSNEWDVGYSRITFLERVLYDHENVISFNRTRDILFEVERKQGDSLWILCLDEYTFGLSAFNRVVSEFPNVNMISVGGNWNGYTPEAKIHSLNRKIGLYNSAEINGGLWRDDYWNYAKKDEDGNPVYEFKSA